MFLMNLMMGVSKVLAEDNTGNTNVLEQDWYRNIMAPIVKVLNMMIVPLLILVGTAGSIYAIVLGVKYARSEDSGAREENKKRLINAVIGLIAMLALMALLFAFVRLAPNIASWISTGNWELPK